MTTLWVEDATYRSEICRFKLKSRSAVLHVLHSSLDAIVNIKGSFAYITTERDVIDPCLSSWCVYSAFGACMERPSASAESAESQASSP